VLTPEEVRYYAALYDDDRREQGHMWSPWPQGRHSQHRNCEPLVSSPAFDGLIRHPRILSALEAVFGAGRKNERLFLNTPISYSHARKRSVCQDRLGTNTCKETLAEKERMAFLLPHAQVRVRRLA
jgi:hypothetical protein